MAENIILEDLTVSFGNGNVVNHISTVFQSGYITGLLGESGSGKSVLGMSVIGLLPSNAKQSGRILFGNRNLLALTQKQLRGIRGKRIGLIPQNPADSLNPARRIGPQMTEAVRVNIKKKKEAKKKANLLLQTFGFLDSAPILRNYSFQLSGGMKQRVLSAMGLACDPEWVIADEPTKGLDAALRGQVCSLLNEISRKKGKSMLIITHDLMLAEKSCQWLMVLYQGRIMEEGNTEEVLHHPLHPYTEGLLSAQPSHGMHSIPYAASKKGGNSGCEFSDRCPKASKICCEADPPVIVLNGHRKVRCHYAAGSPASE
ncbi:ABC transporter ATP-binding protein [Qiania dongpingensis]|uniref:Nickel import system ATP-binding protein NikD n=1 Tax=Qiania dongpingensis TaxID=2763669 RepID=A0A7G9G4S4_9FIRM|nr:ABC transporter ATP-binding protein [Qiania dongpingensis]QNM05806.1 ABC transporter ATP-binding protein [Qiania dongpingensis]